MFVLARYASSKAGIAAGMRLRLRLGVNTCLAVLAPLLLYSAPTNGPDVENGPSAPSADQIEQTNAQEIIRAYADLQNQLRATQLAIEQNRQEAKVAAAQTVQSLSKALQGMQETFAAQRAQDLEATREFDRRILILAGGFATLGVLTMLLIAYLQWCMSRGLAEMSAALPEALRPGTRSAALSLGPSQQAAWPQFAAAETDEKQPPESGSTLQPLSRPRKAPGRSIARRLFPNPGDSFRRRQFRALRTALILGSLFAAVVALILYLMYSGPRP